MIVYVFLLLLVISPLIFFQVCPLCRKRPQNMLYLCTFYVILLILSLAVPEMLFDGKLPSLKGYVLPRPFLCISLFLLSLEGAIVVSFRTKRVEEAVLKNIYVRANMVLAGVSLVSILSVIIMLVLDMGLT